MKISNSSDTMKFATAHDSTYNNVWGAMKTFAILLVVIGHVTRMYTPQGLLQIGVYPSLFKYLTVFIYSFHMPLFFAVSGAIYYINKIEKRKYNNQRSFIINKSKRLLVPYAFFSIFWVFPTMWIMGFVDNPFKYFFESYVLGLNTRHLWFLVVLFEIFFVFNIASGFFIKKRFLSFGIFFILGFFKDLLPSYFQLSNCCAYMIYFYMGFIMIPIIQKYKNNINGNYSMFIIISVVSWILLNLLLLQWNYDLFRMPIGVLTAVFGILILYLVCDKVGGVLYQRLGIYRLLQDNSFGIYLFHPMLIYLSFYFSSSILLYPYFFSLLVFASTLIMSFVFTLLLRKLGLGFAMGE